tara:strand:- start:207 stop:617 length:411 start_codon:yes stop_codon:yes gene_type:complete
MKVSQGTEAIKDLFKDTLNNKEKKLRSALSGKPLVYFVDNNFAEESMKARIEANIRLQSLRFTQNDVDLSQHKDYTKLKKEVRVAPRDIIMSKSVLIWDDKVAIVSTKNLQVTIIENKENANVMKHWFDYIWTKSM